MYYVCSKDENGEVLYITSYESLQDATVVYNAVVEYMNGISFNGKCFLQRGNYAVQHGTEVDRIIICER